MEISLAPMAPWFIYLLLQFVISGYVCTPVKDVRDISISDDESLQECPIPNTVFSYNNLATITVSTWEECAHTCAYSTPCHAWSWMNENFQGSASQRFKCKLKNEDFLSGMKSKEGVTSGLKACTGPTLPPPGPEGNCGVPGTSRAKIVGGGDAQPGEWPWMVGIYSESSVNSGQAPFCGGTLIRDNVVLTAAHCFPSNADPSDYKVKVGDYDVRVGQNGPQEEVVSLGRIYIHERYNSRTYEHDIALLILDERVTLSNQVQTACLPTSRISDGEDCYATGWGTVTSGGSQPHILQEVYVPTIWQEECEQLYGRMGNIITNDMVCAGYREGGKDSCQGDSGGPLVCRMHDETRERYQVVGVTSWGVGCAREGAPGVYARVHHHIEWINNKLIEVE